MRSFLICLILMHVVFESEVSSEEYYKKEHKHKKYTDGDVQKYHKEKYSDSKEVEYRKNHEHKHYKDDNHKQKYYDRSDEEKYGDDRRKRHDDREHIDERVGSKPMSLMRDTEVNARLVNHFPEPQSEFISPNKKIFYQNMKKLDLSSVPDPNNTVLLARYLVHNVDWAALATLTTRLSTKYTPFSSFISMSDGPVDQGSGVPFFYITPMDLSGQDIIRENKVSITVSLAQTDYCKSKKLDAQDPRCARLTLSGKMKRVKTNTVEEEFARKALFTRHPVMESWPKDHDFYFARLKIAQILILDQFGGAKNIDVQEYLNLDKPIK